MTKSVLSKSIHRKVLQPAELDGEIVTVELPIVVCVRDEKGIAVALRIAELRHAIARPGKGGTMRAG